MLSVVFFAIIELLLKNELFAVKDLDRSLVKNIVIAVQKLSGVLLMDRDGLVLLPDKFKLRPLLARLKRKTLRLELIIHFAYRSL